jgi:hypothetical protein
MKPQQVRILVIAGLIALVAIAYWQVGGNDFVRFDDDRYVTENRTVRAGWTLEGVIWAFTTTHASNWHPLTWLSHMTDVEIFGMDAGKHHVVSVAFHLLNSILLFLLLGEMTGNLLRSAFVACLFAVHPIHVESVAWISERKDVLSFFFGLLTLHAYVRYVRKPSPLRMFLAAGLYALGLLSKPMLVTLPFAMLLLDYWPLRRWDGKVSTFPPRIREKSALFLLSAASCLVTYIAQEGTGAVWPIPVADRITNAFVAYGKYLGKAFLPHSLGVFYPHPMGDMHWAQWMGAALLLAATTFLVVREALRRPYLATGWFWFLGMMVPVIGLVQVGGQSMADRYAYIPLVGVYVIVAWGVPDLLRQWRSPAIVSVALAAVALSTLSSVTWKQVGYWRNSVTLFDHTLSVTRGNWMVHTLEGVLFAREGKHGLAEEHYRAALEIAPSFWMAHMGLGTLLHRQGRIPEAILQYREALRYNPADPDTLNNLGYAMLETGRGEEAIGFFREALRIRPDHAAAMANLRAAIWRQGGGMNGVGRPDVHR